MKTTSWSLFTYPVMDIKAAEALLNRRAAEGWTLDRVYLGAFARFVPADTRSAWCVDWSRPGYSERPDYLALCADAGWTLVQKVGAFNLYKAPVGTPPIQTDGTEEGRRFRQEVLLCGLKSWAVLLGLLLVLAALWLLVSEGSWRSALMAVLLTNVGLTLLLSLPAILTGWLLWTGRLLLRLRQWDRAAGGPLPVPGQRSAGAATWLCLLCRLWGVAVFVCLVLDILQTGDLGVPLGLFLGSILALPLHKDRRDKEGRTWLSSKGTVAIYGLILLSVTLLSPMLSPLPDALMPPPVLAEETFVPGAARVDRNFKGYSSIQFTVQSLQLPPSDEGSFALRHQSWWEDPSSEQHNVDCYTARWEWLSRLVQELLREPWYPALEGYTDVWLQEADLGGGKTDSLLLLRSGKTVVMVETRSGPIPRSQVDRLLSLLSSDQEV